jgi:hypothetical protein
LVTVLFLQSVRIMFHMMNRPDRKTVFFLAGLAGVDPRVAEKYLRGGTVRPLATERMRAAIAANPDLFGSIKMAEPAQSPYPSGP